MQAVESVSGVAFYAFDPMTGQQIFSPECIGASPAAAFVYSLGARDFDRLGDDIQAVWDEIEEAGDGRDEPVG